MPSYLRQLTLLICIAIASMLVGTVLVLIGYALVDGYLPAWTPLVGALALCIVYMWRKGPEAVQAQDSIYEITEIKR